MKDVEKPTPKDNEVLVRIHATAILDQIADAFRYAQAGHKKGHVVILLGPTGS